MAMDIDKFPQLPNLPKRTYRVGALAFLVAITLFIVTNYHTGWIDRDRLKSYYGAAQSAAKGAKPSHHPLLKLPPLTGPPTIDPNAHRYHDADEFWPHIRNVTSLPPLSMAEAKSTCNWPKDEFINWNFGEDSGWTVDLTWVKHTKSDKELAPHREAWQRFIMSDKVALYEDNAHRFHGRGLVVVSGDGRSLKRLKVILKQLARLNCKLPLEIHFYGDEMPLTVQEEVAQLWPIVFFNDLSSPHNIKQSIYATNVGIHYQLKTAAMVNSRFEEPLLIDSDNIPVINPEELYESRTYKEYGTIFWPDISRTRINNPIWPITNTHCAMDEYEQESGQLLINKRKFFYHLQLAAWFIDPTDSNPEMGGVFTNFMLGDKDTFRFAWHALKTPHGRPSRWITSVGTLADDGFYCGHTFAQHHPDKENGGVAFLHGGLLKTIRKPVVRWHLETKGGIFQAYKRIEGDQDPRTNTHVQIAWDNFDYMPDKPADLIPASCVHFPDAPARPLDEIVPGFQQTFQDIGGYWMLDDDSVCEFLGAICVDTGSEYNTHPDDEAQEVKLEG